MAILNEAGYARYQERTATMLGDLAELLRDRWRGDLRRLRDDGERDPAAERALLEEFKGVGDVGVDVFCREAQAVWTELRPFFDRRALDGARHVGLPKDPEALAALVDERDLARLAAALVRTGTSATPSATRRERRGRHRMSGGGAARPAVGTPPAVDLATLVDGLTPVSLEELDARAALQRRVDTKHLVPGDRLEALVSRLSEDHDALEIDGRRVFGYESVYFDTPDLRAFHDHAEGRRPRVKVRSRLYVDTGTCVFELKVKRADGETVKEALDQDAADHGRLTAAAQDFLREQLDRHLDLRQPPELEPALTTRFERATLGARSGEERVTCDAGLELVRPDGRGVRLVDGHAVVEVKSGEGDAPACRHLREAGLDPVRMSKYRVGIGLLAARDPDPPLEGAADRWFRPLGGGRADAGAVAGARP